MGLFDKLFGLGLAIAGVTIAIYFTLWTLMVLVRLLCHLTSHLAFYLQQASSLLPGLLLRPDLALQVASPRPPRWSRLHFLLAQEDLSQDRSSQGSSSSKGRLSRQESSVKLLFTII